MTSTQLDYTLTPNKITILRRFNVPVECVSCGRAFKDGDHVMRKRATGSKLYCDDCKTPERESKAMDPKLLRRIRMIILENRKPMTLMELKHEVWGDKPATSSLFPYLVRLRDEGYLISERRWAESAWGLTKKGREEKML